MSIKPGPVPITIGAYTLNADNISVTYDTQFFDRTEFDHDKLKTAPLSTGTQPQIVGLLGGVPAEIIIQCALVGMISGAQNYIPRPLTPNLYPSTTNYIKQRVNITRWRISGASPEASNIGSVVDGLFGYLSTHKNLLAQFQTRLSIFGGTVPYEQLIEAQSDNIQSLYFTTGISFTAPGYSATNVLVVDGNFPDEFLIPDIDFDYTIYKGFDITLEQRIVTSASSS